MDREDTLPWYRQFWPWFIIAPPALTVVAGLYTFWLAVQTTDSLAVRSDAGVNIVTERNLVAEREARRLGLEALVKIDKDSGAVIVTLSSSRPIETQLPLELQLLHPTIAARDASITLLPAIPVDAGQPSWAGHFIARPTGRRYVILSSGDSWRLSGEWLEQATFRLMGERNNGGH